MEPWIVLDRQLPEGWEEAQVVMWTGNGSLPPVSQRPPIAGEVWHVEVEMGEEKAHIHIYRSERLTQEEAVFLTRLAYAQGEFSDVP